MIKTLIVVGTRPEAIKLAPVLLHLRERPDAFRVQCCVTAQHRSMLDQVLAAFEIVPDYDLDIMMPNQSLAQSAARILAAFEGVLQSASPDIVLVQGDTTTTFCAALAAFYARIHVGHVEAGLRTGDIGEPFPEEANRVLTTRLSALHFAPTEAAARNLLDEGVAREQMEVTGNTGIDAVLRVKGRLLDGSLARGEWPELDCRKKLILVTAHRRENFGARLESICSALRQLAAREDVQIVYAVHRNPNIGNPVRRCLGGVPNVVLCDPLDYVPFVDLMQRAYLLLTDSGGIQEEGPSLGKPVLVMRDKTERPEAVEAGTARLVGTGTERILAEAARLLESPAEYESMCRVHNPYGDGHASERIAKAMERFFG